MTLLVMSGLVCAVFIVLTCNIVTGIMLGFVTLVVGRVFAREWQKLDIDTMIITGGILCRRMGDLSARCAEVHHFTTR